MKLDVSISNIQLSDWFHRSTHASGPHDMVPGDGTEDYSLRTATQRDRKVISRTSNIIYRVMAGPEVG
jgi:hypothetical protein